MTRVAAAPPTAARDAWLFGDYELLEQIGGSSTGRIFRARHRSRGQVVALKILSPEAARSFEILSRFQRKVRILTKLQHPNVVLARDAGQQDGQFFLVTQYIDGRDLRSWLKEVGPLPLQHALGYMRQAAAGLGYLHEHSVVHRNVKPSNLLVDNQTGMIKAVGLGLARLEEGASICGDDFRTEPGRRGMGTLDYMAPEQSVASSTVDGRADIYALGCTLYHLLTGQVPYPEVSDITKIASHRQAPIPRLGAVRSDVPPALDMLFQRMVAKRPEDRVQTMEEVGASLARV